MRVFKSCEWCRKRKVKCDQQKPSCCYCLKKGLECRYELRAWSVNTTTQNSSENSENIHNDEKEEVDFYANTFSTPISFSEGPLTWVAFAKRDRFLNMVVLNHKFKSCPYKTGRFGSGKAAGHSEFIQKNVMSLDSVPNDTVTEEFKRNDLIKMIELVLSSQKLVWISIERFFESELYLLFPYVDKDEFIENLVRLIGPPNYNESSAIHLNISKTLDLTFIGILLIMVRFVSLSVYNFGKEVDSENINTQFLLDHEVSPNIHILISRIHQEISSIKRTSLQVFQFISMKLWFELFSPEQYDCLSLANCSKLGELIQYGIQCSLNRDPDQQNTGSLLPKTEAGMNLSRRLWYMIVFIDMLKNFNSGHPLLIDDCDYDTRLPSVITRNETKMDHIMNDWTMKRLDFFNKVRPILKLILNLKEKPTVEMVKLKLIPYIKFMDSLDSLDEIMKYVQYKDGLIQRSSNHAKLMILIQSNSFLYTIYYHLFILYSEKQNIKGAIKCFIELIRIAKILYEPLLFLDPKIDKFNIFKQFGSVTLSFPSLEVGFHKLTTVFLTILCRIKSLKINKGKNLDPKILEVVDEMIDIIICAFAYELIQFSNAGDIYYHTWLLAKVHRAVLFKVLRVAKGYYSYSDFTEDDINFKNSLAKVIPTDKKIGDLGFENYSLDDLKLILEELRGFKDIFNYGQEDTSVLNVDSLLDELNGNPTRNNKKWFKKMIQELGHDHMGSIPTVNNTAASTSISNNSRNTANDGYKQVQPMTPETAETASIPDDVFQSYLKDISNDTNIESLNSIINGQTNFDDLFAYEIENSGNQFYSM